MTEVISPDNKELLTYVLGDIHNKLYIDVVRDLKQQTEQKLESGELEPADFPPVGTVIQANLYGGYNRNIMLDGAYLIDVDVADCKIEKVGLGNSSTSCVDITVNSTSIRGLRICKNKFDQKAKNSKASQRIYIDSADHSGITISENTGTVCTSGLPINVKPSSADLYKQHAQIYANAFDDLNTVVSTTPSGQYVGNAFVGFVRTTLPSSGFWRNGDRLYKENVTVGQPGGWICTASGSSPTWTPLANI
ncbi:hypothetical protein AbaHC9436_00515 [Acinetobacter baumannii]|uniref:hypothetical protein n=1 Tax=Acinetobacter baumannii TaxID=470 RepID=UPI000CE463A3|nr:hypothetical protein [Acinetobacter baumannii]PPC22507.1 hypothetical protein AbaHC9436_00515 [Acinetobacter baumannii]